LQKVGVHILETDILSPLEQILKCSNSNHIIGFHGAGLANAILLKPGAVLSEITIDHLRSDLYPVFSSILNLRYYHFSLLRPHSSKDTEVTLSETEITSIADHILSMDNAD
jgi:capsular polysaccharide biosynthesis protein